MSDHRVVVVVVVVVGVVGVVAGRRRREYLDVRSLGHTAVNTNE
ncbi:hypothetical protein [Microbacterium algeriense]|nr:hypothetical protein [Microbacterium algeriense]